LQIAPIPGNWINANFLYAENIDPEYAQEGVLGYYNSLGCGVDPDWVYVKAVLNVFYGQRNQIQFRFVLQTAENFGNDEGVLIDNFRVEQASPYDLAIAELVGPLSNNLLGPQDITVRVKQVGSDTTSSNFNLSYWINGANYTSELVTGHSIQPNNTGYTHTFSTQYNFTSYGKYDIKVAVSYPGDAYSKNDTMQFTVLKQPVLSIPHRQDFEGTSHWYSSTGDAWQIGTPSGAHIDSAYSGNKALYTELAGQEQKNIEIIESPWYNLEAGYIAVSFKMHKDFIQDNSAVTFEVKTSQDPNWMSYGSPSWYDDVYPVLDNQPGWSGQTTDWVDVYGYNYFSGTMMNPVKVQATLPINSQRPGQF
jgi:hypothetical protein